MRQGGQALAPTILITGRNGQVGWELERCLTGLGHIIATDRTTLDVADPDSIRRTIRDLRPDVIVNPAAYTAVDKAESEPDIAMQVNGIGPGIMAEEAKQLGALLVHYSTDYVFDGTKPAPYTESDEPNPINVYGKTKLAGERAIQAAGGRHLILRTSWVYGARGKNFLLTMLRLAKERDELRIVDDQSGAPTWSRTIAQITAHILARLIPQSESRKGRGREQDRNADSSGVYHLTAEGAATWCRFAEAIFQLGAEKKLCRVPAVHPIATEDYPLPASRPKNSRLDTHKLCSQFGLLLPAWDAALAQCMEEIR